MQSIQGETTLETAYGGTANWFCQRLTLLLELKGLDP